MLKDNLNNVHVNDEKVLITPEKLKEALPVSDRALSYIANARQTLSNIIQGKDKRLIVISGPCSIHDVDAAIVYAKKLKALHDELKDSLYIVMRVYFEKPRTTVGWKGLINDPNINGSFNIEEGLHKARKLLIELADMEIPMATEALDPISPQYLAEMFSWSAIGARTTESQTHREMASGLSMPVGFKNGTDGSLDTAINALKSAASPHSFMGINQQGQVAVISTSGNPDGHVILRGGKGPNYDSANVAICEEKLRKAGLNDALMVDCSHGNSNKDYTRQPLVAKDVMQQIETGNQSIIGIMLESHLNAGNQSSDKCMTDMKYGVSITDACIDWPTTEDLLREMAVKLKQPLANRGA
ncbi:3-deoxy-7-phosphoheptulonate synthase [Catenovulum sediminis]|uniref:Phospho-2-dehydro-3-deoxyheptonate aldolase n=1 Tax=Catenovulum sediminis TaxID=1740262 RepID=A0ABV1RK65_9ALTE